MSIKDLLREAQTENIIIPTITQEIVRQSKLSSFRAEGFHPSEVAGKCPRLVVLNTILPRGMGIEWNPDPLLTRILNDGTAIHEWYQNRYLGPSGKLWGKWVCSRCKVIVDGFMPKDKCLCQSNTDYCKKHCYEYDNQEFYRNDNIVDSRGGCVWCGQNYTLGWGEWKYKELTLYDEALNLIGSCDGLFFHKEDDTWWVLEIKTINRRGFKNLITPYDNHRAQSFLYWYMARVVFPGMNIRGIRVLYVCKDGIESGGGGRFKEKEYELMWDAEAETVLNKVKTAAESLKNESLPEAQIPCLPLSRKRKAQCGLVEICSKLEGIENSFNIAKSLTQHILKSL